jgi:hypothetical protein
MRQPPLKTIEAIKTGRIDSRARHDAVRFRGYFRCLDSNGNETSDETEVTKIQLTPRAEEYWAANQGRSRLPVAQS